jgi:large subunit ribosomal protein LP2
MKHVVRCAGPELNVDCVNGDTCCADVEQWFCLFSPVKFPCLIVLLLPLGVQAAYMLAVLGGNENPTSADVKKILAAVDAKVDDAALEKVISQLKGKKLDDLIKEGSAKLATISVAAAPAAGGAAAPAAAGGAAPAAKKEEKKEEPAEEEDMGFSLFD